MPKKATPKKRAIAKKRVHSATAPEEGAAAPQDQAPASPRPEESDGGLFPIVGIGASAGGLEAFTELLQNLPADTGMGFVFVQHLDPKHVSLLTDLLQRQSKMKVREATNGVRVESNHVYVIPKNTHMSLVKGFLTLRPRQTSPSPHMPIDPFLRSLAADQKSKAIGIILSGNASDGALGMMAIKAAGGITFAQSGSSAKYDSMPRSAVAAGCVDFVLTPAEIGKELTRLGRHPYIAPSQKPDSDSPSPNEGVPRVLNLLRTATGVDFTYYKRTTIARRILRRMALRRIETLEQYVNQLRSDAAELRALYEDILINVTEFFRDPSVFDALKNQIFSKLPAIREKKGAIRIWVPGCSSGEEVYSIAIALIEFLEEADDQMNVQIFGTDISETALAKARLAIYSASTLQDISPERIRRFFGKTDSGYQVNKRIREMCIFARQNVFKDPPFSKLDVISCRNVLIYLGEVLQKRVMPMFHYALKPNGFLLLGSSETVGSFPDLFAPVDKKQKIYCRKTVPARLGIDFAVGDSTYTKPEAPIRLEEWPEGELLREADRLILSKYGPPGVVIDDDLNIVQFRGRTSPYLEAPSGQATLNILKMANEGLAVELRNAITKVRRDRSSVRRDHLRLSSAPASREFNLEVIPFRQAQGRDRRYLVTFEEIHPNVKPQPQGKGKKSATHTGLERQVEQLSGELAATKEYLQSIIEEQEASNEELRSANEEIQSSNEELQSTNEELETAKEELQSTNEELHTVNDELQSRNAQLIEVGNDLNNLLSNVNMPIIMIGNDLRIRRFTPVCERLLNLIATDVGRPISDINLNLDISSLDRLVFEVIESLVPKAVETADWNGRRFSLRIRPYRTEDNRIDGVVIVLVDVDPARAGAEFEFRSDLAARPAASEQSSEELRAFTAGLLTAQESERRRIARELHDELNQKLALLELNVETIERGKIDSRALPKQLRGFRDQVSALSDDLRRIAYQLHPSLIDDLGLLAAFEAFTTEFSQREGIKVKFRQSNIPAEVTPDTALCLYRVLQEGLRNVAKHSYAQAADVQLTAKDSTIHLSIRDSGVGFDPEQIRDPAGLGIRSMSERVRLVGGTFNIVSHSNNGTELTADVPLSPPSQAARASDENDNS